MVRGLFQETMQWIPSGDYIAESSGDQAEPPPPLNISYSQFPSDTKILDATLTSEGIQYMCTLTLWINRRHLTHLHPYFVVKHAYT